jgi:hypothetical protein
MAKPKPVRNKMSRALWKEALLASAVAMLSATVFAGSALAQVQCNGGGGGVRFSGGGGDPRQQAADPEARSGSASAGGALGGLSAAEGGRSPTSTPDDGMHDLFVITDHSDAPGRGGRQLSFDDERAQDNVIAGILTPVFKDGPRHRLEVVINEITV